LDKLRQRTSLSEADFEAMPSAGKDLDLDTVAEELLAKFSQAPAHR